MSASTGTFWKRKAGIGPAVSRKYNPNTIWGGYADYYAPRRHAFTSGTFADIPNRAELFDAISQMKPTDWTPGTVDAIATSTADGRRTIIKAVNYDGARHTLLTRLQGSRAPNAATVNFITITAGLQDANSLDDPNKIRRVEITVPYARDMAFELPPYTVAVVEISGE